MNQKLFRILSAFLGAMLIVSTFPTFVLAEETKGGEFNIFLDAGEISDEFISQISRIETANSNANDYSDITMPLGESFMCVDGEQVDVSFGAFINNEGELSLPTKDLSKAIGITSFDESVGDVIEASQAEKLFLLDISLYDDVVKINKPYQTKQIILYVRGGNTLINNY